MSAYYKELRNMINRITYSRVATIGTYDSYGNIDFGTVKGFNFTYDLRRTNNFEFTAAYTLQFADGTGSDPETQSGLTQKELTSAIFFHSIMMKDIVFHLQRITVMNQVNVTTVQECLVKTFYQIQGSTCW